MPFPVQTHWTSGHYIFGPNSTRVSTRTAAGAAISIPSTHSYGEVWELRYTSALADTQIQGIFLRLDTSVANTSTVRGMEVDVRRSAAVAVGTMMGASFAAYTGNGVNTGNITTLYGLNAEAQIDDTYTGTITNLAGLRVKIQTEDGATVTKSYGVQIDNEFVTGGIKMTAGVYLTATSTGTGFDTIIDSTGTKTTVANTDQVLLWKFLNDAGTAIYMRYDQSAGALVFATS